MYTMIEKDIPLRPKGKWDKLVERMQVGDSCLVKCQDDGRSFRSACSRNGFGAARRKEGKKFRIWKLARI